MYFYNENIEFLSEVARLASVCVDVTGHGLFLTGGSHSR